MLVCGLPLSPLPAPGFPTHQPLQQVGLGMASCGLSQAPGSSSGVASNGINLGLTLNLEPGGLGSNPGSAAHWWNDLRQAILPPCAEANSAVQREHRASCPHLLIHKTRFIMTVNERVRLNPLLAAQRRQTLRTPFLYWPAAEPRLAASWGWPQPSPSHAVTAPSEGEAGGGEGGRGRREHGPTAPGGAWGRAERWAGWRLL